MTDKGQFLVQSEAAHFLDLAQRMIDTMWEECEEHSGGEIKMASANDTVHFAHEELGEVVKAAMAMGLMGDRSYLRSAKTQATGYTWQDLLGEVGDVLLMALTLAIAFDVNASVCLRMAMDKFYARSASSRADAMQEVEADCQPFKVIPREDW